MNENVNYLAPVSSLSVEDRSTFIWKCYAHVVGAILAFAAIEAYLFSSGIAERIADKCQRVVGERVGAVVARFEGGVEQIAAARIIGGEETGNDYWEHLNTLQCFSSVKNLWRVSVAPASDLFLDDAAVVDWGGGVRWLADPGFNPRDVLVNKDGASEDGHATLVKYDDLPPDLEVFQPLAEPLHAIHSRLKNRFDPAGIFNPGRMYRDI